MADQKNKNSKVASSNTDDYTIDLENFSKRLKDFYTHWKGHKDDLWSASDAIVIAVPPYYGSPRDLKSYAINVWLFGLEFPETIMVFMNKEIHFLCSPKKARLIERSRMSAKESVGAELVIHVKAKNADGIALMDEIFNAVRFQAKDDSPAIGYIAKEAPEGKLLETWSEKMTDSGLKLHDVTDGFSELLAVKDAIELTYVKKAALLTSSVMLKFVVPKLEHIIDEGKKVTHSSLMKDTIEQLTIEVEMEKDDVDVLYPKIFQSGDKFDNVFALLDPQTADKLSVSSDDDNLYYDSTSVIICDIGSRYKGYCSNVARTFLIDPTNTQLKAYEVLLKAHDAAICALKPGKRIGSSYEAAIAVVQKEAPELLSHLTKSAGSGIGLDFCESSLILNSENDRLVNPGMVFNVMLGFQNLQTETKNPKTDKFSLLLSDMVVIVSKMHAEVLTAACSKETMIVSYTFIEEEEKKERPKARTEAKNSEASEKEKRRLHQAEFARQKGKEPAKSLGGGGPRTGKGRGPTKASSEKLQLATNKMMQMRLPDVWIRTGLGGCGIKVTGTLEAGVNGFMYSTKRAGKQVEINYMNIKHAFYQPADRETITLLHFHLHNDMMVSKKETKDVQFYVEVIDAMQTCERSSAKEGDRKKKINKEFQRFVNKVQEYWRQSQFKLEFDQPLRELGFHGQASTFMAPTSTCLVQLTESPSIIITLSEVEIFNLERVSLISQTNFDMTIIFKDFKREVFRVDMIPFSYLDEIKGWLKMMRLKFYERRRNVNWQPILQSIRNKKKFIEAGGWESLNMIFGDFNSHDLKESDPPEDEDSDDSEPLVESDEEEELERERKRKLSSSESRGSKRRG